jgi:hypothetical protein
MAHPSSYNSLTVEGLAKMVRVRIEEETLGNPRVKGTKFAVLLGAGASVTAGIPLSKDIVAEAVRKHGDVLAECGPSYAEHMALLPSVDKYNLLRRYVDRAAVNAAHLYLAQLVSAGFVDRILTTNFDSLAAQALLLVNERPFVYDLANMKVFQLGQVASPSVIHLHGQFGGFVTLHTEDDFRTLGDFVATVLTDTLSERTLIVVGYSGLNDPVFDQICRYGIDNREYPNGLVWVSHKDAEPPEHVFTGLLENRARMAYYLREYDADSFFMALARTLGAGLPTIVQHPFTFLKEAVREIKHVRSEEDNEDQIAGTRGQIELAIRCHEKQERCARGVRWRIDHRRATILKTAQDIHASGRIDGIDGAFKAARKCKAHQAIALLARTLVEHADRLLKRADEDPAGEGKEKAREAVRLYRRAAQEMPDPSAILCSCGDALVFLATHASSSECAALFKESYDCYSEAKSLSDYGDEAMYISSGSVETVDYDPPLPEITPLAYEKWGDALKTHATLVDGELQLRLLREALDKFYYSMRMWPDSSFVKKSRVEEKIAALQARLELSESW